MIGGPYTTGQDEKTTQVLIGTPSALIWGELVTKAQARVSAFLNTLAEDFVPLHNTKILFLAPSQQAPPVERSMLFVRLEEILLFLPMSSDEPLPEETHVRQYEAVEAMIASFQIEGAIMKSPVASLQNMLLVSREAYLTMYKATVRHVAKPWLGTFSGDFVQLRHDQLLLAVP
ncbi:MAG: hypothetical protein ACK2UC_15700 [Anaerolineae bacterium]|jgi:hypothetical protein